MTYFLLEVIFLIYQDRVLLVVDIKKTTYIYPNSN